MTSKDSPPGLCRPRPARRHLQAERPAEIRGARVRGFGEAELIEVYPVRAVLEEFAAKEATKHLDGDVSVLEAGARGDARGRAAAAT